MRRIPSLPRARIHRTERSSRELARAMHGATLLPAISHVDGRFLLYCSAGFVVIVAWFVVASREAWRANFSHRKQRSEQGCPSNEHRALLKSAKTILDACNMLKRPSLWSSAEDYAESTEEAEAKVKCLRVRSRARPSIVPDLPSTGSGTHTPLRMHMNYTWIMSICPGRISSGA